MAIDRAALDAPTVGIIDAAPGQVLRVGPYTATSLEVGRTGQATKVMGGFTFGTVAASKTAVAASAGSCALDSSGTVTVTTTAVSAGSFVMVQMLTAGGTVGGLYRVAPADIVAGTSFIIRSFISSTAGAVTAATTDTSTVAWWIIG